MGAAKLRAGNVTRESGGHLNIKKHIIRELRTWSLAAAVFVNCDGRFTAELVPSVRRRSSPAGCAFAMLEYRAEWRTAGSSPAEGWSSRDHVSKLIECSRWVRTIATTCWWVVECHWSVRTGRANIRVELSGLAPYAQCTYIRLIRSFLPMN